MERAKNEKKKEYYRNGIKACLRPNEKIESVPQMYEELQKSLEARETHIKKLFDETKQIKKLRV